MLCTFLKKGFPHLPKNFTEKGKIEFSSQPVGAIHESPVPVGYSFTKKKNSILTVGANCVRPRAFEERPYVKVLV